MGALERRPGRLVANVANVAIVAAAVVLSGTVLVVTSGAGKPAPADDDAVTIAPGIPPALTSERVPGISRG